MGKLLLVFTPAILLLGLACTTTTARTRGGEAGGPRTGRELYEASCSRCHALFMPASFDAADWPFFVRRYGRKARLNEEQRALVLEYVTANARDAR